MCGQKTRDGPYITSGRANVVLVDHGQYQFMWPEESTKDWERGRSEQGELKAGSDDTFNKRLKASLAID
jgi:hypothetical protein